MISDEAEQQKGAHTQTHAGTQAHTQRHTRTHARTHARTQRARVANGAASIPFTTQKKNKIATRFIIGLHLLGLLFCDVYARMLPCLPLPEMGSRLNLSIRKLLISPSCPSAFSTYIVSTQSSHYMQHHDSNIGCSCSRHNGM